MRMTAQPTFGEVHPGYASDRFGSPIAFAGLAGVAAAGLAMIRFVMPETRRLVH